MNDGYVRPLGVGQLLDRAVAGYVRAFFPVVAILAVAAVPSGLAWAFLANASQFSADLAQLGRAGTMDAATRAMLLQRTVPVGLSLALAALVGGALSLLARTACFIFIEASCDERPTTIGAAFRAAVPLWLPQVGVALVTSIGAFAIVVALTLAAVIVAIIVALATSGLHLAAIVGNVVAIVVAIVAALALLAFTLFFTLLYYLASVAVAGGQRNPWRALIGTGRPLLDRRHWRTTAAISATLLVVSLFASFIAIVLGLAAAAITRVAPASVFVQSVVAVVLSGLIQWFVVLYARDVRDRHTGDDLLRLADADIPA